MNKKHQSPFEIHKKKRNLPLNTKITYYLQEIWKQAHYNKQGLLQKWEEFTIHNAIKYLTLSEDNIQTSIHTPTKTLLFVVHLPEIKEPIADKYDYVNYYESQTDFMVKESPTQYGEFSSAVVYNDYEDFIDKVVHYIHFM